MVPSQGDIRNAQNNSMLTTMWMLLDIENLIILDAQIVKYGESNYADV